jgi:hypothetical protein
MVPDYLADAHSSNTGAGKSLLYHFIETTGQGAFKMTCCAVDPIKSLPSFDLLFTPTMISLVLSFFGYAPNFSIQSLGMKRATIHAMNIKYNFNGR